MAEHLNPVTGNRVINPIDEPRLTTAIETDLRQPEQGAIDSVLSNAYGDADYYQRVREMTDDATEDNANAVALGLDSGEIGYNNWTMDVVGEALRVDPAIPSATMDVQRFGPKAAEQDKNNMTFYLKAFDTTVGMYCTELKNDVNYNSIGYDQASSNSRQMWYGINGRGGLLAQRGAELREAINKHPEIAGMLESKLAAMAAEAAAAARRLAPSVDSRFAPATDLDPHFGGNFNPLDPKPIVMANLEGYYSKNAAKRDGTVERCESIIQYNMLVEATQIARKGSIHEVRANYKQENGYTPTEFFDAAIVRANDDISYFNTNHGEIEPGTTHRAFQDIVAMGNYIQTIDGALAEIARTHDVTTPLTKAELTVARANAFERMNELRFRQQELIMMRAEVQGRALSSPNPDYSGQLVGLPPSRYVQPLDRNQGIFLSDSRTIVYPDGSYGVLGPRRGTSYPIIRMDKFGAVI